MNLCEQLIQELDDARARMRRLMDQLPPELEVYPGWTKKQFIAHITGWDDLVIATIQRHLIGEPQIIVVSRGLDYYNASTVTEREALPLEQIEREYTATREQLKAILRTLPPERLNEEITMPWGPRGSITRFIRVFSEHEAEHEEEIRQILGLTE